MRIGGSCIEGDLDTVRFHVRQQAVDTIGGGLEAHLAGTGQAL